jgi:hypothetical protein
VVHRGHRILTEMVVPVLLAADASVGRDAGRSDANLEKRQEEVRDCPLALDRDFLWAWNGREHRAAPVHLDVLEQHQGRPPPDALLMAVCRPVPQAVLLEASPVSLLAHVQ